MLRAAKILSTIGLVFSIIYTVSVGISLLFMGSLTGIIGELITVEINSGGDPVPEAILAIIPVMVVVMLVIVEVIMILSIVFTNSLIKKLKKGCPKKQIIASCVLAIIFGFTTTQIGAILTLAAPQRDFGELN